MFVPVLEESPVAPTGYVFPHAGATAAGFAQVARTWAGITRLRCVDLPGRLSRIAEPARTDFPALVADASSALAAEVSATNEPYLLIGVCGGALLGLEVARTLRHARIRPPAVLVVISAAAPDIGPIPYRIADLPSDALWAWLREHGGIPERLNDDAAFRRIAERALRADFALFADYRYRPQPPLDVPIIALHGAKDEDLSRGEVLGWRRQSSLSLRAVRVPGAGRWLLEDAPDEVGRQIAAAG